MTVFEIMPSLWLFCVFFFGVSAVVFDIHIAAAGFSASLASLFFSILSQPMYFQCAAFFIWASLIIILSTPSKKKINTAMAVTEVTDKGGIIKFRGKCHAAYSRDKTHKYRSGDIFTVRNDIGFSD